MKQLISLLACGIWLSFLLGCKPSLPDGVLSESKMERVLYDFHLAQGMAEHAPRADNQDFDGMRYELQQAVFRKHGIAQEDFDRSMTYYLSDMEKMSVIYKHVSDRLEREADALGIAAGPRDLYARLTSMGDTANVWSDRPLFAIRNSHLNNFQMWNQLCDSTWFPGDDVMLRFELKQLTQTYGRGDLYADLVIVYENDSVRGKLTNVAEKSEVELRIDNPEDWRIRSVSGHFFSPVVSDPQQTRIFIVFAPSLIRFHKLSVDSAAVAADRTSVDSIAVDSTRQAGLTSDSTSSRRLSPEEFRDLQPVDRTIDVVKEKPYKRNQRGGKKRFAQPKRLN